MKSTSDFGSGGGGRTRTYEGVSQRIYSCRTTVVSIELFNVWLRIGCTQPPCALGSVRTYLNAQPMPTAMAAGMM
jgi:hypothetical protein